MFSLARSLQIEVHLVADLGSDGAVTSSRASADVWLEAELGPAQQRFALAHAIGHLIGWSEGEASTDATPLSREQYADAFAGALLIPKFMLLPLVSVVQLSVEELVDAFEVPLDKMIERLAWVAGDRDDF